MLRPYCALIRDFFETRTAVVIAMDACLQTSWIHVVPYIISFAGYIIHLTEFYCQLSAIAPLTLLPSPSASHIIACLFFRRPKNPSVTVDGFSSPTLHIFVPSIFPIGYLSKRSFAIITLRISLQLATSW